jgi:hypothetical protein
MTVQIFTKWLQIKDWTQTCYAESTKSSIDYASDLQCFKNEIEKLTADSMTYDV